MTDLADLLARVKDLRRPSREMDLEIFNAVDEHGPWGWSVGQRGTGIVQEAYRYVAHGLSVEGVTRYGHCSLSEMTGKVDEAMDMAYAVGLHPYDLLEKGLARAKTLPRHAYDDCEAGFLLCRDMMTVLLEEKARA